MDEVEKLARFLHAEYKAFHDANLLWADGDHLTVSEWDGLKAFPRAAYLNVGRAVLKRLEAEIADGHTARTTGDTEPIPPGLAGQMAELRKRPGQWFRVMFFDDPATIRTVADFLGTHPDARGFAWALSGGTLSGCYYGEAPAPPAEYELGGEG